MEEKHSPLEMLPKAEVETGRGQVRTRGIFLLSSTQYFPLGGTTAAAAAKPLQSCPTLCDPIDGSPPGSAIPGILQARTLEWVAISFSNA